MPEAERQKAGGLQSGDLSFDMTIGDAQREADDQGARRTPARSRSSPPRSAAPAPPGAGGGAAQPEQPGSAEARAPRRQAARRSKYQQCLADAGQDVEKLQDCGQLIGQ